MGSKLAGRSAIQLGALFLIGDGVMGLINSVLPRCHSLVWHVGPELAKAATEELESHRVAARALYMAEAAIGVALIAGLNIDAE